MLAIAEPSQQPQSTAVPNYIKEFDNQAKYNDDSIFRANSMDDVMCVPDHQDWLRILDKWHSSKVKIVKLKSKSKFSISFFQKGDDGFNGRYRFLFGSTFASVPRSAVDQLVLLVSRLSRRRRLPQESDEKRWQFGPPVSR